MMERGMQQDAGAFPRAVGRLEPRGETPADECRRLSNRLMYRLALAGPRNHDL